jgi:hypothetical protein
MTAVQGVHPSRLRKRLAMLLAAMLAALVLPAVVADAAFAGNATMIPSVKGPGSVSAPFYSCSNPSQDDRVVWSACSAASASAPLFGNAVLTMTATPFPNNGNQFSHWEGCALPAGALATVSMVGTTCTLTVGFAFGDVTITPRAVFDDVAGPVISAVIPAYSPVTDRGVSFVVAANEPTSALQCSVDGSASFAPCGSVRQFDEGTHQVRARAFDMSGNAGATTAPSSFRVVDTSLVSGPADFSADKRPRFIYSTLGGLRFECSIDNVVISTACGDKDPATNQASFTPQADLADGVHTFRVEGIDGPDFDRVPVVRTWRVDTTAPVVNDLASPTVLEGIVTTARSATFTWGVTEIGGVERFECRLDGGAFEPCATPKELTGLPFGERAFSVRGVDRAGNAGEAETRTWTVAAPDNDGDGFDQRSDCNDDDARINPIAADTPDNGVDENCDGADSKSPPLAAAGGPSGGGSTPVPAAGSGAATPGPATGSGASTPVVNPALLSARGSARGRRIVFTRLTATSVPVGARIDATCSAGRGGACPFRTKRTTARRATVDLIAAFAAKRRGKPGSTLTFRAPATLTITVTRAGMAPNTLRYTIAKGKFPKSPRV